MNKWIAKRFCFVFGHIVRYHSDEARDNGYGTCLVCGSRYPQMSWYGYSKDVGLVKSDLRNLKHWYFIFLPACFYEWVYRKIQQVDFLWCAKRGHDLVDEGYAGPDSGCEELVCRRCGYSYGRRYLY